MTPLLGKGESKTTFTSMKYPYFSLIYKSIPSWFKQGILLRSKVNLNYFSSKGLRESHSVIDSWSGEFRSSVALWKRPRKCLSLQESHSRTPLLLVSPTARSIWFECSFQSEILHEVVGYRLMTKLSAQTAFFLTFSLGLRNLRRLQWWISLTGMTHATTSSRRLWE